jgi:hypothetical protein
MPIRYITEDTRSEEQARADDHVREEIEGTGGVWAQMSAEQRALIRARLRDKKQRAQAARVCKQAEQRNARGTRRSTRGAARAAWRLTDHTSSRSRRGAHRQPDSTPAASTISTDEKHVMVEPGITSLDPKQRVTTCSQ